MISLFFVQTRREEETILVGSRQLSGGHAEYIRVPHVVKSGQICASTHRRMRAVRFDHRHSPAFTLRESNCSRSFGVDAPLPFHVRCLPSLCLSSQPIDTNERRMDREEMR